MFSGALRLQAAIRLIGEIVEENERGAFLSRLQKIQHAVTLVASIVMALLLGSEAPLFRYSSLRFRLSYGIYYFIGYTAFIFKNTLCAHGNFQLIIMIYYKKADVI